MSFDTDNEEDEKDESFDSSGSDRHGEERERLARSATPSPSMTPMVGKRMRLPPPAVRVNWMGPPPPPDHLLASGSYYRASQSPLSGEDEEWMSSDNTRSPS